MKHNLISLFAFAIILFWGCSPDNDSSGGKNAVAFVNPSLNLSADATVVNIVFAAPVSTAGTVTIQVTPLLAVYGQDFSTAPAVVDDVLILPFAKGSESVSFTFNRLAAANEGQQKNVTFTITSVSPDDIEIAAASKSVQVNFDEAPILVNTLLPDVGGPNVPNQVYIDLSSGIQTAVQRTKWDLGFYSGEESRVVINGALKMAVKQLDITDMTQVVTIDNTVGVGEGGGGGIVNGNIDYVDGPDGDVRATAIAEVSSADSENKVYLLNLGYAQATEVPGVGSVSPYGEPRGWKKIRILRNGAGYKLQYADVTSTTFEEVAIDRSSAFNFTFFSFEANSVVLAEPEKAKWDLNFTPFTNHTNFGAGLVSYSYQDFIVTNKKGGTRAYQVLHSAGVLYSNFTAAHVEAGNFEIEAAADQRVIGSSWRNGGGPGVLPSAKDDRFYVVKDVAGNIYKVRFISMTNQAGERGNPTFEYKLL